MISKKVTDNIQRIFEEEKQRIVFWNDGDRAFERIFHPISKWSVVKF